MELTPWLFVYKWEKKKFRLHVVFKCTQLTLRLMFSSSYPWQLTEERKLEHKQTPLQMGKHVNLSSSAKLGLIYHI